ncbi:unnamed protein product [Dovyalis caffra]|uniref:5'-3' exonuclease domain-containing protein n=1 Tax=Dovyalis caffra TaxID=77055 RepID=A0AAV1QPQ3_9ROSI|nr:unnamed protein product [Dovyalis caffra]
MKMVEIAMPTNLHIKPTLSFNPSVSISTRHLRKKPKETKTRKLGSVFATSSTSSNKTIGEELWPRSEPFGNNKEKRTSKKRVFFLDVNPLCYAGSTPSLHSFGYWISLFFSQVSLTDPVIAVLDGEGGSEHRRQLLPSYKAHRRKFSSGSSAQQKYPARRSHVVMDILTKCNVPVVKIEGHEADDVVATLAGQVLQRGYKVVIASPDKDFKQLISEDVQIVLPIAELNRWSFYTLKHYISQYSCDPCSDLSLRCIMGDEVDGVPGIQNVAPGFGRKTALKLLKKHGSLQNLLDAAAVRTVGKQYAQDALTKHADYLRRNYEILALRRDVDVELEEEWLVERDKCYDSIILSNFFKFIIARHLDSHEDNRGMHVLNVKILEMGECLKKGEEGGKRRKGKANKELKNEDFSATDIVEATASYSRGLQEHDYGV